MPQSRLDKAQEKHLSPYLYFGYGMLLACSPKTSATEVAVSVDVVGISFLGWLDQVVFILCFIGAMALFSAFSRYLPSIFDRKGILPLSLCLAEIGVAIYAFAAMGPIDSSWALFGSALRGIGYAGLTLAWLELFVDMTPRIRHAAIVFPLSLLVAAILGLGIWLLTLVAGVEIVFASLAVLPLLSCMLLYRGKKSISEAGIHHLTSQYRLAMPRTTRWIVFVFGVALGCTWAVFYSLSKTNLPFWACMAFLLLSIFMVAGIRTFMPRKELEFGFALRWSMLLSVAGFLLLPITVQYIPDATAFLLALAWAAQILLLLLMPIQISSKLPVNLVSVASQGGASYGIGAALGSFAAGIILFVFGQTPYAYSAITALVCIFFATAALYFPGRNTDATVLGMETAPENELHTERIERRSKEVAEKWLLTARESEILYLLALGKSRSWIATELNISEETVKTHSKHIYEKLDVHSLRELVILVESGVSE
ncbi:MAG: helix-turn-helix transcriptional regulator [Raoultibacter sp.]